MTIDQAKRIATERGVTVEQGNDSLWRIIIPGCDHEPEPWDTEEEAWSNLACAWG